MFYIFKKGILGFYEFSALPNGWFRRTVMGLIVLFCGAYIWLSGVGYFGFHGEYNEWHRYLNEGVFLLILGAVFLVIGFVFVFILGGM